MALTLLPHIFAIFTFIFFPILPDAKPTVAIDIALLVVDIFLIFIEPLDAIEMPRKPNAILTYFLAFIMFGIWGVFCLILPAPLDIIGLVFFVVMAIWQGSSLHSEETKKYKRAKEELKRIEEEKLLQQHNEARAPRCPMCGSSITVY